MNKFNRVKRVKYSLNRMDIHRSERFTFLVDFQKTEDKWEKRWFQIYIGFLFWEVSLLYMRRII